MILKTITAGGLRGPQFKFELGRLSVIVGPNMSGKTRVLDAIQLALLGYIPGKDKTHQGIFRTASGSSLNVSAVVEDNENNTHAVERAWLQKADNSITTQKTVPGALPPIPLVVFDANDYFSRSEADRLQMVFERMNLEDVPIGTRIGKIAQAMEAAGLNAARQLLSTRPYTAGPTETFQAWLERVLAQMKEIVKGEKDTAKRMEQTVHGLTELALQNPTALPDETATRAAIEECRRLMDSALQSVGSARQAMENNSGTAQRVLALDKGIEDRRNRVVELPTLESTLKQLQSDLERHQGKAQNIPGLRQTRDQFTSQIASSEGTIVARTEEITRLDADYAALIEQKCCPTCAANKPTWRNGAKQVYDAARANAVATLEEAETTKKAASDELDKINRDLLVAEGARSAGESTTASISTMQSRIATAKSHQETMIQMQEELAGLRKTGQGNSETLAETLDRAEQEVEGRRHNLEIAEANLRAIMQSRGDAQKLEAATRSRDESKARSVQIGEGVRVLQESRDSLMMDAFKPLLQTANLFATGILKTPLEYRRGELGRVDENNSGRWISQTYFSGLELATMHCAISAALGSQSPIRLVLIDELGRLDSIHKQRFLLNVERAIAAGVIDQLVAVDVASSDLEAINQSAISQQRPGPVTILRTGQVG